VRPGARMPLVLDRAAEAPVDRLEESVVALELLAVAEALPVEALVLELEQEAPELEAPEQPVVVVVLRPAPPHSQATRKGELDLALVLGGGVAAAAAAALRSQVDGVELVDHPHHQAVLEEGGEVRAPPAPPPSHRPATKASAHQGLEAPNPARAMALRPEGPREALLDRPMAPTALEAQELLLGSMELQEGRGLEAREALAPMALVTMAGTSLGTTGGAPGNSAPRFC